MPGISIRSGAVAILATACLLTSCGPSVRVEHPIDKHHLQLFACDGFLLREAEPFEIEVDSLGGREDLGGGNWIEFAPNAVQDSVRYQIQYLRRGLPPGKKAGIEIRRIGSAPIKFNEPVLLHLSYAACDNWPDDPKSMVRFPGNGDDYDGIGGAMSAVGQYVEVLLNDFSGFAIAI